MHVGCHHFVKALEVGATKPCLVGDTQGQRWVAKYVGNPLGPKAVFNEFVAGSLANAMGLPWPEVAIVDLGDGLLREARASGLTIVDPLATGVRWVEELSSVPPDFSPSNAEHVLERFGSDAALCAFHGKVVFDNWLLLQDTKYDTLHRAPDGSPIFLDSSHALDGTTWCTASLEWDLPSIMSPYLEGLPFTPDGFEPWLCAVVKAAAYLPSILGGLPASWRVPEDYRHALAEFVCRTQDEFVPCFRDRTEWQQFRAQLK